MQKIRRTASGALRALLTLSATITLLAATGHFLLGAPVDGLDYVFRRAWVGEDPPANTYELIPMEQPMVGSGAGSGTGAGAAAEGGGQK